MPLIATSLEKKDQKWPKVSASADGWTRAISDDFMKHWREILPRRYTPIEWLDHGYVLRTAGSRFRPPLEIGEGLGEHLHMRS